MKKIFAFTILSFFVFAGGHCAWALDAGYKKMFKEANTLYAQSKYDAALEKYQKLSLMEATPEAYFNLGNAYIKTKKLGLAIASYETAKMLAPRDLDIRKNLRFAKSLVQSKLAQPTDWYLKDVEKVSSFFSLLEVEIVGLGLAALTLLWMILLLALGRRPFRGWVFRSLITLILIAGAVWGMKYYFYFGQTRGVVIRPDAEVRYGPSKDEKVVFRLPEGLRVRLLEDREGWERVQMSNKDNGWISKDDVQIIKIA
ncbi:MAG: tetratricopeptide repeat protein [Candidatus Omnitrophica bacterium]|nr:tetratricopeptide repeat protein [Candidatus Omnitrophota bacterium]